MTVKIDNTDISEMIKFRGLKWSLNSVDAPGAGRNLAGTMQRKLVALKEKLEISCRPITTTQLDTLVELLSSQFVSVIVVTDTGTKTLTMYPGGTVSAGVLLDDQDGNGELWGDISFSLIQK